MTTTVEAIYENGVLKLPQALDLPNNTHVLVTIESEPADDPAARAAWLDASKQCLTRVWNNSADDVFKERV